jgi:hypothetical protein
MIRIDTDSLSGLEGRITSLCDNVYASVSADLGGSPPVAREYDHFVARWDDTRDKLFDGLNKISGMLKTLRETFVDTDEAMAEKIRSSGGG